MSDMIKKPGVFGSVGNFIKHQITGENKEGAEGTWGNETVDYMVKGGTVGGLAGAGLGAAAHYAAADKETMTYTVREPKMRQQVLGEIPSNHISATPDIGDPRFVRPDGKPVAGTGVKIEGQVPEKNILGQYQFDERTVEAHWKGSSLLTSMLSGALIGTAAGVVFGAALKVLKSLISPFQPTRPWERSAPPAWSNSAPPAWKNSASPQPWARSAPDWSNAHNKAPYNDTHYRSHDNYGNTHSNYSNYHSNYGNTHYRSHDNYSNSHSNYSNTHSNYSNSHSNAWDRSVSY